MKQNITLETVKNYVSNNCKKYNIANMVVTDKDIQMILHDIIANGKSLEDAADEYLTAMEEYWR